MQSFRLVVELNTDDGDMRSLAQRLIAFLNLPNCRVVSFMCEDITPAPGFVSGGADATSALLELLPLVRRNLEAQTRKAEIEAERL